MDGKGYCSELSLKKAGYRDVGEWFHRHNQANVCVIEHIEPRGGMALKTQTALVGSYEQLRQAASVLAIEPYRPTPQVWQATFGLIFGNKEGWSKGVYRTWKKRQHHTKLLSLMDFWYAETGEAWQPTIEAADAYLLAYMGLQIIESGEESTSF